MDFRAGMKIDYKTHLGRIAKNATLVEVFPSVPSPLLKCRTREGLTHFVGPFNIMKIHGDEFAPEDNNPNKTFKMYK